jgi:predicted site-specific integrase-resolvase
MKIDIEREMISLKDWRTRNGVSRTMAYNMIKMGLPVYRTGSSGKFFVLVKKASDWLEKQSSGV